MIIKCPKFLLKRKFFMTLVKQTLFMTVKIGIGTAAVGFYSRGESGLFCLNHKKVECTFIAKE